MTSDMKKVFDLFRTREGYDEKKAGNRVQLLEWLAFKNQYADKLPTYFVAEEYGKIIGHLGRMPTEFIIKGRRQKGYFIHDLYIHPEYRKKGKGLFLAMALYRVAEENSDSFLCGMWSTPLNLEIQRRRGYYELHADKFVKLLDPSKLLDPRSKLKISKFKFLVNTVSPILKFILNLTDLILLKIPHQKVRISEIIRFDSRFDELTQRIYSKVGISVYKQSDFLNWKYIDRPFNRNKVFAVEDEYRNILGFVVLGPIAKENLFKAHILDIWANPEDSKTISALCKKAIEYFKEQKVYSINCFLTDKRFAKVFKKFLFLKDPSTDSVFLGNLEKCQEEKENLIDLNNWHLSYGDSDGDMLRT
jgi:GNAT superfamily N-acetyltransferase